MKTNRSSLTTSFAATKLLSTLAASLCLLGSLSTALADSPLNGLGRWHWRNPLPQGNDLYALIHANGQFVAVGDHGSILQSVDGAQWTVHNLEIDVDLKGIAYGNGVFVAVGEEPAPPGPPYLPTRPFIVSSADGTNWNTLPASSVLRAYVTAVAFGNGTFVMVGYGGYSELGLAGTFILTSTNGINWRDRSESETIYLFDVTFANGKFVAVGIEGSGPPTILTSFAGADWERHDAGAGFHPTRVAYGNGRFVAVSDNYSPGGSVRTSADGMTWTQFAFNLPGNPSFLASDLSFIDGVFMLTASEFPPRGTLLFTSPDGENWSRRDIGSATNLFLNVIALANGVFAAVGEHGNLASSADGTNWTAHSAATDNNLRGVAYGSGRFVAVGNNGTNLTSPDGVDWTGHLSGTTWNLHEVSWVDDQFIAVGSHGTILRSDDGALWTPAVANTTEDLWDIAAGSDLLVAVGGNSDTSQSIRHYRFAILSSSDGGLNWTNRLASPDYSRQGLELHSLAYGNGLFVAVGQPHALLTSTNGINWVTNQTAPFFYYLKGIVCGNGRFVAVGDSTNALVSDDGVTWVDRPLPVPQGSEMDDVAYTDGAFIAVGENGIIVTSNNGLDWTRRHSPTDTNLRGVIFGTNGAVVVGNNDLILQSGIAEPLRLVGRMNGAGFELSFAGELGASYRLQAAPTLPATEWMTLQTITNTHATTTLLDATTTNVPQRFYRIVAP